MILHIIIILIIILLVIYLYYKGKYQFWSRQPVFHTHNIFYWMKAPFIIQRTKPIADKYFNPFIYFDKISQLNTEKKALFIELIKKDYLSEDSEKYSPTEDSIMNYFKSHNYDSHISMYFDKKELIATITSRPLECLINNKKLIVCYLDYMCVEKNRRKQGIGQIMMYTHYVNIRYKSKYVVGLAKREGVSVSLVVPLVSYDTYIFNIEQWDKNIRFDQSYINVISLTEQTKTDLIYLFEEMKNKFKCIMLSNITNILHLCNRKELYIKMVLINKEVVCFYVFRNSHTTYHNKKSIELIASYNRTTEEIFTLGMLISIGEIYKKNNFELLTIEEISDNDILLKVIKKQWKEEIKTIGSYYFYNLVMKTMTNKEVIIIN